MDQFLPQCNSEEKSELQDRFSLRYSKDRPDFDLDRLSYTTDGTQLDFKFEQFPQEDKDQSITLTDSTITENKSTRKKLFQKFHRPVEKKVEDSSNDILDEFDKIFHIDKKAQGDGEKKEGFLNKLFKKKKKVGDTPSQKQAEGSNKKQNISSLDNLSAIENKPQQKPNTEKANNSNEPQVSGLAKQKKQFQTCDSLDQSTQSVSNNNTLEDISGIESSNDSIIQQKQEKVNRFLKPIFEQEERMPIFLRKVKLLNSVYPNFNNPKTNIEEQIRKLNLICSGLVEALYVLQKITVNTLNFRERPKYFNKDLLKISYFLTSGWQKHQPIPNTHLIKPRINLPNLKIRPQKMIQAINNYEEVLAFFTKSLQDLEILSHPRQKQIQWYKKIRNKFWAIQVNIRTISEDVYILSLQRQHPNYIYWYLSILRSQIPTKHDTRLINDHKKVLNLLIANRQRGDILSMSEVGQAVKNKVERELKILCPHEYR